MWYLEAWEEQEEVFQSAPREGGRHNLLMDYAFEQWLIKRKLPLEELFVDVSQGTPARPRVYVLRDMP